MEKIDNVDKIDLSKITLDDTIDTDVLVVGAGDSGMMAAVAAREAGAKVILIEKEKTIGLLRLSNAAVGSNAQKQASVMINKYDLVEYLAAFAQHNVDQKLLNVWADNSAETVNWLEDTILKPHGAHLRSEPDAMVTSKAYQGFPTENDPTIDDKSYVSYGDWFVDYIHEQGIDLCYQTSLVKLIKIDDTNQYLEKGLIVKADTIEELAEKLHLPVDALKKTVERQNQNYVDHIDHEFGKEFYRMSPIDTKPYYGCILGGRILGTLDGLRVNEKMEVLDENYEPINHLYTAGNDSGGFFWGSYPDRVPGLASSHAQTFGRLAGKNAANN